MLDVRCRFLLFLIFLFSTGYCFSQSVDSSAGWHHADYLDHEIKGVSTQKAYSYLESQSNPLQEIVVAVIDGDLDVNHEDLKHKLWKNPKVDSRKYPGAKHGWNFLGVGDGRLISKVGTEAFREYKRLRPKYEGKKREDVRKTESRKEFDYFLQVKKDAKIQGYLNFFPIIEMTFDAYRKTDSVLRLDPRYHEDIRLKEVVNLKTSDTTIQEYVDAAVRSSWKFADTVKWQEVYTYQTEEYNTAVRRIKSLDNTSNPRDSIGDNQHSLKDKYYGNSMLVDSSSFHGTFVAGLIGAERNNNLGIDGIAENAYLMGIRAVPDGDEFDKDIALAIRFAVDHGAQIINMSFGKYYSPKAQWVTDAIQYALKKNVLVVQAAGNDNRNLDTVASYPRPPQKIKRKRDSYLLIGASTSTGEKASFSNYGLNEVDFFAPGEKVTSTATFDSYKQASGTSFSAPIVSGIAALVWGSHPKLKAYQVAEILKLSAEKNSQDKLKGYAIVPGIINAHDALQIAKEYVEK